MSTPTRPSMPVTRPSSGEPDSCTLLAPAGLVCSKHAGHEPPCAPPQVTEPPPRDPPPGPPAAAHSASENQQQINQALSAGTPVTIDNQTGTGYFIPTSGEFDLMLPSGGKVRYRKIRDGSELELDLVELLDGFTPELLRAAAADDGGVEVTREVAKPQTRAKLFGPVDRVVVAAVVCPTIVLEGPTTGDQVNVKHMDLLDRMEIFNAAFGEQLSRLKSLLGEQGDGLRDLPEGQDIRAATQ